MKKNNKGFVLAEAIIVSVFVLGMFTYLAMNVIPLISRYERVVNYDNPQEIYLANTLYEEMMELETSNNVQNRITMSINNNNNVLKCNDSVNNTCTGSSEFYEELGKALKIEAIYTYSNLLFCGNHYCCIFFIYGFITIIFFITGDIFFITRELYHESLCYGFLVSIFIFSFCIIFTIVF